MEFLNGVFDKQEVVPLTEVSEVSDALALAELLAQHGYRFMEIPLRNAGAMGCIRAVSSSNLVEVGVGTILDSNQLQDAISSGATFGVSPSFQGDLVAEATRANFPYMPGIATPTEAHQALNLGAAMLKVFPAHALGGPGFISSLSSVFPQARFMPSGGIDQASLAQYLAVPSVLAVSGSWLTPTSMIRKRDWSGIEALLSAASSG